MENTVETAFAQFCDAVAHADIDVAGLLLTEHLGAFISRDLDATRAAVAGLDIRLALMYPAVAVLHPRQYELTRFFPRGSSLPSFAIGRQDTELKTLVYVMTFVREAGRVRLAQKYADQIVERLVPLSRTIRKGEPLVNAGNEWLLWFQLGRTRLVAGELLRAYRDLTAAMGYVRGPGFLDRLTRGYLALVAALRGDTSAARQHLDQAGDELARVGSRLWGLHAAARAIVEVEEHTPECDDAVAALDRIEDQAPLWPYILLAQTRHAEVIGRSSDSLALIESAESIYSPEAGSFAYDVLVARRIEALIISARLPAARAVYEDRAFDAPHCRVASLALLVAEHDFDTLDRKLGAVLAVPNLTTAQRVQAQAFAALGGCVRDHAVPDSEAPGLGYVLSLRAHRRVALMFPSLLFDALDPYLSQDLRDDLQRRVLKIRLWDRGPVELIRSLTPRQVAMLRHLDHGLSYAEIAETEQLSVNTVKSHLKKLYKRLGASTSSNALVLARQWGLLDPGD